MRLERARHRPGGGATALAAAARGPLPRARPGRACRRTMPPACARAYASARRVVWFALDR
ncbi:hypothetical protein A8H30_08915 [Burkholderia thailandensis]|nr:hypothetical protein A8H30_08915 [Burkholderia thailandensis]